MSLSIAIIQDRRRKKKLDKYPLKLRVIFNRRTIDYPTIYNLTIEEFEKFSAPRISNVLQDIRTSIQTLENDAKTFVSSMNPFSFESFEVRFIQPYPQLFRRKKRQNIMPLQKKYEEQNHGFDLSEFEQDFPILKENSTTRDCISTTFIEYITNLLEEERIGTAINYQDAYFSFKKFSGNVPFSTITKSYLIRYEKMMIKKGCTLATIGIKMRGLRAIFNYAIDVTKIISREIYPFGKGRYRIPTNKSHFDTLGPTEIKKAFLYEPVSVIHKRAKAYWFFCYLGNGMNPSDMATLQYRDIQGDYIKFIRNKTKYTTRENPKIISVYLTDELKSIIEEWGNSDDKRPNNYIFPVLKEEMSALDIHFETKHLCKFINDGMKFIFEQIEIEKEVSNKIGRKSYATQLKRIGAPTEFIQDALGHMNITTTQIYLEDYEDAVKKDFSKKLSALIV